MKKSIVLLVMTALLIGIMLTMTACGNTTVDLNKYVTISVEGNNGQATASFDFDMEAFYKDCSSKIKSDALENDPYGSFGMELGASAADMLLDMCVDAHLDQESRLSNGDKVTLEWNVDEELAKDFFHVKFNYSDITYTVSGLEEKAVTWDISDDCTTLTVRGNGEWIPSNDERTEILNYKQKITKIVIEEGITNVDFYSGSGAEGYCLTEVTEVSLPSTLKRIKGLCCSAHQLTSVELPEGLEEIGDYTFHDCALKEVTIPKSVTTLGSRAFLYNYDLKSVSILGTVSIGDACFGWCESLDTFSAAGMTTVGSDAFKYCAFESFEFPEGTIEIGDEALTLCENLKKVTFPSTLTTISKSVAGFNGNPVERCYNLEEIIFNGTMKEWLALGLEDPCEISYKFQYVPVTYLK